MKIVFDSLKWLLDETVIRQTNNTRFFQYRERQKLRHVNTSIEQLARLCSSAR